MTPVPTTPPTVYVVVPGSIDDPARPSGGNSYDRRICRGLATLGWSVHERPLPGAWPRPDAAACATLAGVLVAIPDGSAVLIDGLIASTVPDVLAPEANRLRLVVLVHMSLGDGLSVPEVDVARTREGAALSAAVAIITTSTWTRTRLLDRYPLRAGRVHVAQPGVDAVVLAPGTAAGGELLCVAAVTADKGHEVLLAALAMITDLPWRCVCVGSLHHHPGLVDQLGRQALRSGIGDQVRFTDALTSADLDAAYAAADVLVLATRAETYSMVVSEALARGLPVIATAVGGLPEALGRTADGSLPGLLVPRDDPAALAAALRGWLGDTDLRQRLRDAARERRLTLAGWSATSARISRVLTEAAI